MGFEAFGGEKGERVGKRRAPAEGEKGRRGVTGEAGRWPELQSWVRLCAGGGWGVWR